MDTTEYVRRVDRIMRKIRAWYPDPPTEYDNDESNWKWARRRRARAERRIRELPAFWARQKEETK